MKQTPDARDRGRGARLLLAGASGLCASFLLASAVPGGGFQKPGGASFNPVRYPAKNLTSTPTDTDGDGLPDPFEFYLGTDPLDVDSDDDGFSDTEELARGSFPLAAFETPGSSTMGVGLALSNYDTRIHLAVAMYFEDGSLDDKTVEVGTLLRDNLRTLNPTAYGSPELLIVPSHEPDELIAVLIATLDSNPLHRTGAQSFFATLAGADDVIRSAAAVNLISVEGVIMELSNTFALAATSTSFSRSMATQGPGNGVPVGTAATGLHRPLGGSSVPATWVPGSICAQAMSVVGVNGPVVREEVTAASCESGFDGSCSPTSCSGSVGSLVDVIDPLALLGG